MSEFVVGCAIGFLFVGCIAAPFVAPWRIRVRYLEAAQVADPVFGFGPPLDVTLRTVNVSCVAADRGHVDLVVDESDWAPASYRRRVLKRDGCTPGIVAKLDGWAATHTPVLMITDECGDTHLYGPDGAVTHLERAEEMTR